MTESTTPTTKRPKPLTREEIAQRELGVTTVGRGTVWFLFVAFLATICVVPIVQHAVEIGRGEVPQAYEVFTRAPTQKALHEFERRLEDESVFGKAILPRVQGLLVELGAGNEQAYLGREGRLFHRPGFDYVTGRGFLESDVLRARSLGGDAWEKAPVPDPIPAIVDFRDQLAARGIELVIVPTPLKPQFDPEHRVDPSIERPLQNPSYARWRAAMDDAGVRVYDPAPALVAIDEPYLLTDTHWRPDAMAQVAGELAALVRSTVPLNRSLAGFRREATTVSNLGDIAVMLRLPDDQTQYARETVTIMPVSMRDGTPWKPDANARVLVLGDSFANIYSSESLGWGEHAGLCETLAYELQHPVDRITINGGGASTTRRALREELARGNDRLAGKKLVIWQFAVRELAVGDWELLDLPEVVARNGGEDEVPSGPIEVRARVAQRASPPSPGSVPYADCLIAVYLEDVAAVQAGTTFPSTSALVYVDGMRANEWTTAARWSVGDAVRLELQRWQDAPERARSTNREDLDDDELLLLDPWWGVVK